ncbi:LytR/AlgR family response regulator transcription factor [Runella aurantiaca]|uniref:DNA-binding response regulator n=1 Tax=Runella aurantiaca TaxID=2282308 RepID=A0A369I6W6_9BACT|nr:LytTR family DNA-binding domain-containing protein [Runella aurantiaca]RDB05509.1 DNA-binding response regulator [Runella aurantiaca]
MKVVIIEDEALAARQLKAMVQECDENIEVITMLDSVESSIQWLRDNERPDLLLMDIELCDGQSFEIFSQVEVKSPVIFTTAYNEYAIQAFKVNSIDYLLKPIDEDALKRSLYKFQELKKLYGTTAENHLDVNELVHLIKQTKVSPSDYRERFLLKQGSRLVPVSVDDIAYFYSQERLSFVKTWDERSYVVDYTLDELECILNPKQFFRANRQIILCPKSVDKIHLHFNSRLKLDLRPCTEEEVFISRDKAGEFRNWMGE